MENKIQVFTNEKFGKVRTLMINNEPWFVGKDVAVALGYKDTSDALKKHVDTEDKLTRRFADSGQSREMYIINESGVYSLVLSSKLPTAKKFKRWVTSEVLPSIRKTGGYVMPKTFSEALMAYAKEVEARERLELENTEMRPKAEFYDDVTGSEDTIDIGEVAKVLHMGIGRNKLFQFLRDKKVLAPNNAPYQRFIDAGYFRRVESSYEVYGTTHVSVKTVVFQRGVDYIRKLLKESA
jgi:prophage antirepressor-like protein